MKTSTRMLHEIPDLVAQVDDAPASHHPDGAARQVPGSKPPLSLAVLHVHLPDGGRDYIGAGLRGQLGMCIRLVIEEDTDQVPTVPDYPDDTWVGMTAWLLRTHHWWSRQPWASDIDSEISNVWHTLRRLAHITDQPRLRCTRYGCNAAAELQPGGQWVRCANGHTLDVNAERGRHLSMQDWTLAECRRVLLQHLGKRVPQSRLEKWVERGQLQPIRHEWRKKRDRPVAVYNFGAVMRLVAQWEQRHADPDREAG